jgi:hypothetical protein
MRSLERADARALYEILRVVLVTGNAQRKSPQARQHTGKKVG